MPIGMAALLTGSRIDIEVPDGQELVLNPEGKEHAAVFHSLRVSSIEDLVELTFIPASLKVDAVRRAMATGAGTAPKGLRSKQDIRLAQRQEVSRELAQVQGGDARSNGLMAANIVWWADHVARNASIQVQIARLKDIKVNAGSTLVVAASTKFVWADDVRIRKTGKIKIAGSFCKFHCRTLRGNF